MKSSPLEKSSTKKSSPMIKGIFVNSHIKALEKQKGKKAIQLLEKKYGKSIHFKNSESILVSEEVRLIELVLDILNDNTIRQEDHAFEAGRLHFKNFSNTPLGTIIFTPFRKKFKLMMMNTKYTATHIFKGVRFLSEDLGAKKVKVTMKNNDYPIDHFQGFFQEWMNFAGYHGIVKAQKTGVNQYEYLMTWK